MKNYHKAHTRRPSPDSRSGRHAVPRLPVWLFWLYLLIITSIEALVTLTHPIVGLLSYALLLIVLTLHSGLGQRGESRRLALALTLIPLVRLLAFTLPLMNLPQMFWYPVVALPLLLAAWVIVRQAGLNRHILGLHGHNHTFHLMMMTGGVGLGAVQYAILQTQSEVEIAPINVLLLPAVLLILLNGFTEELIFRGLIQTTATPMMKRWALVYAALMFAVLHIGYLSVPLVIFAFLLGLLFGQIFAWSRSIIGVALVHGTTNATQLVLLPTFLHTTGETESTAFWMTFMGTVNPVALIVLLAAMTGGIAVTLMTLGYLAAAN